MPNFFDPDSPAAPVPAHSSTVEVLRSVSPAARGGETTASSGKLLGGRFSLQREIGRGGAGTVFEAFDTKVGQKVAVKVLHADIGEASQLERLRREVRASRPGHPNAVAVFDLFDDGRCRFLTMELVEGRSLRSELSDHRRLSIETTVGIGRQIAAALTDLHHKGLVHRDVKPGNILLAADEVAKLCDMGLARSTMRGGTVTETEMVVGTPAYMAPEQALAGELTSASDVYALGLTLFQCLTGEVPLQEDTAVATLMLRQQSRPPNARSACSDCPVWLDRLLRRMLDPEPGRRPSAAAVGKALTDCRMPLRFAPRRHHVVAALVVVAAIIGSIFLYQRIAHPSAAAVEAEGSEVVGYDDDGVELWRHRLNQANAEVLRADLDGDSSDEVLIVGRNNIDAGGLSKVIRHSEILILDAGGEVITRLDPEGTIGSWPYRYRLEVTPTLHAVDLDRDGWLEVVAVCRQRRYFPTEVLVYWPRWNVWDHVLSHSGSIYKVFPPRRDSEPGFRFLGVNNRLAMYGVLGEMWVVPPDQRGSAIKGRFSKIEAPPFGNMALTSSGGLLDYVPLVPQHMFDGEDARRIDRNPDGGWSVTFFNRALGLDAYYNPADGPNVGHDLKAMRRSYFLLLYKARPGFRTFSAEGVDTFRVQMEAECGPLLNEASFEAIFLESLGRSMARTDDVEGAVALLRPAYERLRNEDLGYRLANLEAISGDLESATDSLRKLMVSPESRRAGFDAPQLMLRVAMEGRDVELFESSVAFLTGLFRDSSERYDVRTVLWAGARLWWDEGTEADARVNSLDYTEDGDAVACLTRWRRNGSRPADPDAMGIFIETNPDAAGIGHTALVAALIGNGRISEAIEKCDIAVAMLGEWSKDEFREHQNLKLIRALRTVAVLESGDRDLARGEALRLSDEFDPSLLPGILVAEVLAATGGDA